MEAVFVFTLGRPADLEAADVTKLGLNSSPSSVYLHSSQPVLLRNSLYKIT